MLSSLVRILVRMLRDKKGNATLVLGLYYIFLSILIVIAATVVFSVIIEQAVINNICISAQKKLIWNESYSKMGYGASEESLKVSDKLLNPPKDLTVRIIRTFEDAFSKKGYSIKELTIDFMPEKNKIIVTGKVKLRVVDVWQNFTVGLRYNKNFSEVN